IRSEVCETPSSPEDFAAMGLPRLGDSQQHDDSPPATLGEIVLVGPGPATPESEWVALVRSIAAREVHALHALYLRTHRVVFTLIMRITRHRETSEELTLE